MKTLCLFLLLLVAVPVLASVPKQITVQGVLLDKTTGQPVTGTHVLKLNLYDAPSGGTLLYSDVESVTIDNGLYSVALGTQIAMPDSLTFDRQYYLGVSIDNGVELSPRTSLTPAPNAFYSVRSGLADQATKAGHADIADHSTLADSAVIAATAAVANSLAAGVSAPPNGAAGGDLSGTYPSPKVTGIQTRPVAATAPTVGQTLVWDGSQWAPAAAAPSVAFSVLSGVFQTLTHDVATTLDFNYNNTAGGFDDGSYFSLDSDWFTAPVAGYYFLDAFVSLDTRSNPPSNFYMYFTVNGNTNVYRRYYSMTNGYTQLDFPLTVKLKAGDHVRVQCNPSTNSTSTMGGNSYGVVRFSGFKIN